MTGPMSNYAAPPQLVEGVPYRVEFSEQNKGKFQETDRLGGFCLLIKHEVIKRIGPDLDKWTDLGLLDTDILSAKARQAGFNLTVCRDMFVHHFDTRVFAHTAAKVDEATTGNR